MRTTRTLKSQFQEPGSLAKPRAIGRIVRLLMGAACLDFFRLLVTEGGRIASAPEAPSSLPWWLAAVFGFYVFSYVVNIGFTLSLRHWPQVLVATIGLSLVAFGLGTGSSVWTPALGWFLVGWLAYTYGHLGVSFVLSSVLGTPGCEMRAIPHLISLVTGQTSAEHFCPGPLRSLDAWELKRSER